MKSTVVENQLRGCAWTDITSVLRVTKGGTGDDVSCCVSLCWERVEEPYGDKTEQAETVEKFRDIWNFSKTRKCGPKH